LLFCKVQWISNASLSFNDATIQINCIAV
jgi:hypothetical protein